MRAGFRPSTESLEALAERVVAIGRRRVDIEERLEGAASAIGLAGVEIRPPERL
jgi:hypothetical protein